MVAFAVASQGGTPWWALLLAALAGTLSALGAAAIAYRPAIAAIQAQRDIQTTDLFTRAVEMLADSNQVTRVGGIYTLKRILRTSPKDHAAVVEVLAAFLLASTRPSGRGDSPDEDLRPILLPPASERRVKDIDADVQAAVDVLGHRPSVGGDRTEADIHLRGVELSHTVLRKGHLCGVRLRRARLGQIHWEETDLTGAKLRFAHLEGAYLYGANLTNASLVSAWLIEADLENVILTTDTDLEGAHLARVQGNPALTREQVGAIHCRPEDQRCAFELAK
jgi:hypothetical protein